MDGKLARLFALDLRSLGLLRIGLGGLLLVDLAARAGDLQAHYTDVGVLPRELLSVVHEPRAGLSLHALASGSTLAVTGLFVLAGALALALLVGWRTRLAVVASWALLTSLQWRNPGVAYGGDVMLRMLLFWSIFLPLDARFSLAAVRRPGPRPADAFVSVAGFALLLQLCLVYWFSVLHRTGPLWWQGEALWYALHYDQFVTRLGVWARDLEALLPPLTWGTLGLEILGPLLLFVPIATGPLRTLAVGLFLLLHLGLALLMDLGLFPAVFAVAWLALLPAWFWERLPRRLRVPTRTGPPLRSAPAVQAAAGLALVFVVLVNVDSLDDRVSRRLPRHWDAPARALSLDQRWALIAPPPRYDGWYVFDGELANGDRVDPAHPTQPPAWTKPELVSDSFGFRWRHYLFDLALQKDDPRWAPLGRYWCRQWNRSHAGDERLERLNLYFVRETTLPTGPERGEILLLHTRSCA